MDSTLCSPQGILCQTPVNSLGPICSIHTRGPLANIDVGIAGPSQQWQLLLGRCTLCSRQARIRFSRCRETMTSGPILHKGRRRLFIFRLTLAPFGSAMPWRVSWHIDTLHLAGFVSAECARLRSLRVPSTEAARSRSCEPSIKSDCVCCDGQIGSAHIHMCRQCRRLVPASFLDQHGGKNRLSPPPPFLARPGPVITRPSCCQTSPSPNTAHSKRFGERCTPSQNQLHGVCTSCRKDRTCASDAVPATAGCGG